MALPDGPKASSLWQMLQWVTTPFSFMQACRRQYGDCFTIRLSQRFGPLVLFSHPEALQVILANDDAKLFDAPGSSNVTLELITGTQSVFAPSGDRHRRARHYSPFEFLPFGGGIRRCIGMAFAQFEMKLVLSSILARFDLARADARSVRQTRRGLVSGPTPFRMIVRKRLSPDRFLVAEAKGR
jgi:cytochrome P450